MNTGKLKWFKIPSFTSVGISLNGGIVTNGLSGKQEGRPAHTSFARKMLDTGGLLLAGLAFVLVMLPERIFAQFTKDKGGKGSYTWNTNKIPGSNVDNGKAAYPLGGVGPKPEEDDDKTGAKPTNGGAPGPAVVGVECCNVKLSGTSISLDGIRADNKLVGMDLDLHKYLTRLGISDLSETKTIAYGKDTENGTVSITLVFNSSLLYLLMSEKTVGDGQYMPMTLRVLDGSAIFQKAITVYGANVVLTTKSTIMTTDGIGDTYSNLVGNPQLPLTENGTSIEVDAENNIIIRSPSIKTDDGKPGYYFMGDNGKIKIVPTTFASASL